MVKKLELKRGRKNTHDPIALQKPYVAPLDHHLPIRNCLLASHESD